MWGPEREEAGQAWFQPCLTTCSVQPSGTGNPGCLVDWSEVAHPYLGPHTAPGPQVSAPQWVNAPPSGPAPAAGALGHPGWGHTAMLLETATGSFPSSFN